MAEKTAEGSRSKELHDITKSIVGLRKRQAIGVKDKQGVMRTGTQERIQRWIE